MPIEVTTGAKVGTPVTISVNLGENLQEMIELFGDEMIHERALRSFKISFQSWVMEQLKAGKTQEQITEAAKSWKPGKGRQKRSPLERLAAELAKLSPEEQQAFLQAHKAKKAA